MRGGGLLRLLNGARKMLQRAQDLVKRRGHRRWVIAGHTVLNEKSLKRRSTRLIILHDVVPDTAMNVNVNQPWGENAVTEIDVLCAA